MHGKAMINRRSFCRGSAGIFGLSLLSACGHTPLKGQEPTEPLSLPDNGEPVAVQAGLQPRVTSSWLPRQSSPPRYEVFRETVLAATDFSWLSAGDRVLLKLALNSGNSYPATTDPWALWCMIKLLKEKGAGEIVVGDQSGVHFVLWTSAGQRGSSRELCRTAGLLKILEETGATPCFFEERGYDAYRPVTLVEGKYWEVPVWITTALDEVDHVIYLSRVSSHVMGDITSGFKMSVGFLREDSRLRFHQGGRHFYEMYEEVNAAPPLAAKFRLAVCSARKVLSNFGPDTGHVSEPEHGLLFASEDLIAHELFSYAWLKWNREFATPEYSNGTTGRLTAMRSSINRLFVWYVWRSRRGEGTPAMPFWQAGSIYEHPAILNAMRRRGGKPERIQWEQVNRGPEKGVADYVEWQLLSCPAAV